VDTNPEAPEKIKARRAVLIIYLVMVVFIVAPLLIYLLTLRAGS